MKNENHFDKIKVKYARTLSQYVPIVDRVHGYHHPEFHRVREIFELIANKIENTQEGELRLDDEFKALREVTGNYTTPEDVCESYEGVYNMLRELDEAYNS